MINSGWTDYSAAYFQIDSDIIPYVSRETFAIPGKLITPLINYWSMEHEHFHNLNTTVYPSRRFPGDRYRSIFIDAQSAWKALVVRCDSRWKRLEAVLIPTPGKFSRVAAAEIRFEPGGKGLAFNTVNAKRDD